MSFDQLQSGLLSRGMIPIPFRENLADTSPEIRTDGLRELHHKSYSFCKWEDARVSAVGYSWTRRVRSSSALVIP